ncbi:MAG: hypothetical protein FJW88_13115 [Actinobacteria bacterium]|nr:hypothetical protein [Actinomycetota bacterium]
MARRCGAAVALAVALVVSCPTVVAARPAKDPEPPTQDSPGAAPYRPYVDAAVVALAGKLGVAPIAKPYLEVLDQKNAKGGEFAQQYAFGDPVDTCLIQLQPKATSLSGTDLAFVLTHEVFHCYQDQLTNDAEVPGWVEEGAATWAAATLVPGSKIAKQKWGPYLDTPGKSLTNRSYDAIGFFGHLEHAGVDVWARLVPLLHAGSQAAALELAFAPGDEGTLDNWPSGLFRQPAFGAAWVTDGPDIPAAKPPREQRTVSNGKAVTVKSAPAAVALVEMGVTADVVTVTPGTGRGRLHDAGALDGTLDALAGRPLCALDGGCECPAGSAGAGIVFTQLAPGDLSVGVTGGKHLGSATLVGKKLADYCKKPVKVDKCLVGTWVSEGMELSLPEIAIDAGGGAGSVLVIKKSGAGSVDAGPSMPVIVSLPGGVPGTFKLNGTASGVVYADKGSITTLTAPGSTFAMHLVVPGLLDQKVDFSSLAAGGPLDGSYTCTKKMLEYRPVVLGGGRSTWKRA